ncbi:MAG: YceI family protein [Caldimicrobium sp.]|nr:YceI family protein [Caldimicrobium sp.]MCX7874223.1 YceI family protein [Caldimicrobium sp.]MDW8094627.1 YceI family protein [Caldimicrobium sp.]
MKRFLFYFLGSFLLLFLLITLVAFNLEYLVNSPFIKERVKSFLWNRAHLSVDYQKIDLNIYKLLVNIERLTVKGKDFEFFLPKGRVDFDWQRFLSFDFYPSSIYLKNPNLKIYWSEEPTRIKIEFLNSLLKRFSEFSIDLRNATFEYELERGNFLKLESLNLKANNKYPQLLIHGKAKGNAFSLLEVKLRYNFHSHFGESSISIKNFDLAKLKIQKVSSLSKTSFDVDGELTIEKGKVYAGFTGSAPCIAFGAGETPLVCGFFQGTFQGNRKDYQLSLAPIDMKYPQISGELHLVKTKDQYSLQSKVTELKWSDLMELILPRISEMLAQKLSERIKNGLLRDLVFESRASTLVKLFSPENFSAKGNIFQGEFYLPEKKLTLTNTDGELSFENRSFQFRGWTLVEGQIKLYVSRFYLNPFETERTLYLKGTFDAEASHLQKVLPKITNKLAFLKDWEVKGPIRGELSLQGKLEELQPYVALNAEDLGLKITPLKDFIYWKKGTLAYEPERLTFQNLTLTYGRSYIADLEGNFAINNLSLQFKAKDGELHYSLIEEYGGLKPEIQNFLEKYRLSFSTITFKDLTYGALLPRDKKELDYKELLKGLRLEGSISTMRGLVPIGNHTLSFESPEARGTLEEGQLKLISSRFHHNDSFFLLNGQADLFSGDLKLWGKGKIGEHTLKTLEKVIGKGKDSLALKGMPLEIGDFHLELKPNFLAFYGNGSLDKVDFNINMERKEKVAKIKGKVKSKNTDFNFSFQKDRDSLFNFEGLVAFNELATLFESPRITDGKLEGKFSVEFNPEKWPSMKRYWEEKDVKKLLKAYLRENPFKLLGETKIDSLSLSVSPELIFSGFLFFETPTIRIKALSGRYEKTEFYGEMSLWEERDALGVDGHLTIKDLDLRAYLKGSEEVKPSKMEPLEVLSSLPLNGKLSFNIEKLILPTAHHIENLKGRIMVQENQLVRVEFPEVNFCGLPFYAEIERDPDFQYFFVNLPRAKGEFLDFFSCLYPEEMPRTILEGPFIMEGFFYTDGYKTFFERSYGKISLTSNRGYLYRAPLLVRLLAFLSPIDLFRGKVPNLEYNLLPYEELNFTGELENSKLYVDSLFLSAPGFRLFGSGPVSLKDKGVSMTFLVSPFKTLDVVLEHIPYLSKLILGKERMLIYLPIEVLGTYEQPQIVPLHPASIGKGLFRFIFKFFGLQEEFFHKPRIPSEFKRGGLFERRNRGNLSR